MGQNAPHAPYIIVMYICINTNTEPCHLWRGSVLVNITLTFLYPVVRGVVGGVAGVLIAVLVAVILVLALHIISLRRHLQERIDFPGLVLILITFHVVR